MQNPVFSPMIIDAIGEVMNISLGSSATAVSNMLDHRVDITTPTVTVVNVEEFSLGKLEPAIGVEIKYVCGLEGSNIMMLKRSDVKAIVDILLCTETPDEEFELNELSISAVCEVMNQMMGAASTALSDLLGRMVNISTPESFSLDDLEQVKRDHFPVTAGPVVVVSFKLSIEGVLQSEFLNVMSVELAKDLAAGLGLEDELMLVDSAPASAPAPAAAPSSGGTLSQEEIEKLMGGMGAPAPAPAPAPAAAPSSGGTLSQEEIEKLMGGMGTPAPTPTPTPAPAAPPQMPQMPPMAAPMGDPMQMPGGMPPYYGYPPYGQPAEGGYPYPYPYPPYPMYPPQQPAPTPPEPKVIETSPLKMKELQNDNKLPKEQQKNLDLIMSVPLEISVEIGRTRRKIQEILSFSKGSLVVLDKLAGDQVDLFVNGQCVAKGDVVVIDDNFGIRITEVLDKPDLLSETFK